MRRQVRRFTFCFAVALVLAGCQTAGPSNQRWEYRVIELPSGNRQRVEQRLNELGQQGWSLVDFTEFETHVGGTLILKRARR